MSKEFTEVNIQRVSIREDLTDDEGDGDQSKRKSGKSGDQHKSKPKVSAETNTTTVEDGSGKDSSKAKRKSRNRKMGQKAASLKFSAADFIAASPDKLKKHYTIGKLLHRGKSASPSHARMTTNSNHKDKRNSVETYEYTGNSPSSEAFHHANVHMCVHRDTGIQRAVKVVKKYPRWNKTQNQVLVREFKILQTLDHPSLLRTYELFEGKDHFYIVMDLCRGGDLCHELDAWGHLQEAEAAMLLKQLLGVVNYLHHNRIVHGNIKPEHILLEQDKDLDHVKLTDFACAEIVDDKSSTITDDTLTTAASEGTHLDIDSLFMDVAGSDDDSSDSDEEDTRQSSLTSASNAANHHPSRREKAKTILPERKGTEMFWAPEVVLKASNNPKRDVWACGVLCYLLLSNQFPFHGETREEICEHIVRGEFFMGEEGGGETDENDTSSEGYTTNNKSADFYSEFLKDDGESALDANFDWAKVSDSAKSFVRQLLTYDERKRPTAKQALEHPWIVEMTSPKEKAENGAASAANEMVNSMATMAAWNNVAKFNASNKLKQAVLTFIAAQMVLKEERKTIDHVFRSLDIHNVGRLSKKEVKTGYKQCFHRDLTDKELDELFDRVDLNKTGYLEYSEFVIAAMNENDLLHRQKIQQAFSVFDRDGSGTISKSDLKEVLTHFKGGSASVSGQDGDNLQDPMQEVIDDEAIDKIMQQADMTGSGDITYGEFMVMMLRTTDEVDSNDDEYEEEEEKEEDEEDVPPLTSLKRGPPRRAQTSKSTLSIDSACSAENMKLLRFTTHDFVAEREGDLSTYYDIEDFIDEGSFGKVFVCKHKATSSERALKVIDKSRWKKDESSKVLNEFSILKGMSHPNMIKFYDLFQDPKHYYIVMDICRGGDLCEELITWGKLEEKDAATVITQVLSCLNYCHSHKVVHRDMKPDNILLQQTKDLNHVKVIDFGFAKLVEDGVEMKERVGTGQYMAPEVVNRSYFGCSCDMWSVGVICYVILSAKFPFKGRSRTVLFENIVTGKYTFPSTTWGYISEEAKDFIEQLLSYEPEKRPTAQKALLHPWLQTAGEKRVIGEKDDAQALAQDILAESSAMLALTNMKNVSTSKLKEAVKTFIASQLLLSEEKRSIEEVFRDLDITKNGKLSKSEVQAAHFKYFGYGLSNDELDELFRRCDHTGTGFIEYSEFVVATMNENVLLGRQKLKKAFELFDADGNGLISASDLKEALCFFSPDKDDATNDRVVKRLLQQVDADGDGLITYDEFVGLMINSTSEDVKL